MSAVQAGHCRSRNSGGIVPIGWWPLAVLVPLVQEVARLSLDR